MQSNKKQQNIKSKEIKTKKKILKKTKQSDSELSSINSNSYFRIIKELEKQNSIQKFSEEMKKKEAKPKQRNINELIYINNSKKLGNYYNKNQNDLLLYGSSKYDVLPMDNLLKEMGQYQSKVINKINENKVAKKKNSEINEIIEDYDTIKNKTILTPLAENEKDRSEMETLEKKNFDEAKRLGVVMRRIEYTYLLNKRINMNKEDEKENKEMILKLKNSVDTIEKYWLKHKKRKILRAKRNAERGHIEIQYLASNDNFKKIEKLEKKCEELNKSLIESQKEVNRLNSENKELQILNEESDKNKKEEFNDINNKYNDKISELNSLNQIHNDLLLEKNKLQENYEKLLEEKNSLNDKYNEITENINKKNEEINNNKNEYETLLKQSNEKEEKIKNLEENIENINKEKYDLENENKLLKEKISSLDGEFDNFKKSKNEQDY